jgi:succinyl-diaminopimelate desuccinylase
MSATLTLTEALIARPSLTPDDAGCQALIMQRLKKIGFVCETFHSAGVTNLFAMRPGQARDQGKWFAFAGHTDVVPPGPFSAWSSEPFTPTQRDGKLYGRGAADMKGSLASFIIATENFVASHPKHQGSIVFLITSDEEGPSTDGTIKLVEMLKARGHRLDYCIVGEPTCTTALGDTIKNGRRGSLSGRLILRGMQGHVAYPHLANNPIHRLAPALAAWVDIVWGGGNEYFPDTTFQISNIHAGTGVTNVIPGEIALDFNFRFSCEHTPEQLKARFQTVLASHGLIEPQNYTIDWVLNGLPFLTPAGVLSDALSTAIQKETGLTPTLSTTGGTSDGRFIIQICDQLVEFGPLNASIHRADEHVDIAHLEVLTAIYQNVLTQLVA